MADDAHSHSCFASREVQLLQGGFEMYCAPVLRTCRAIGWRRTAREVGQLADGAVDLEGPAGVIQEPDVMHEVLRQRRLLLRVVPVTTQPRQQLEERVVRVGVGQNGVCVQQRAVRHLHTRRATERAAASVRDALHWRVAVDVRPSGGGCSGNCIAHTAHASLYIRPNALLPRSLAHHVVQQDVGAARLSRAEQAAHDRVSCQRRFQHLAFEPSVQHVVCRCSQQLVERN